MLVQKLLLHFLSTLCGPDNANPLKLVDSNLKVSGVGPVLILATNNLFMYRLFVLVDLNNWKQLKEEKKKNVYRVKR